MEANPTSVKPYIIGITGGIASGKSVLAEVLAKEVKSANGVLVNADILGHKAYNPETEDGKACRDAIEAEFKNDAEGNTLLMEDGIIDRRKLGPIVFASKLKMDALNAIVWPVIAKLFQGEVDRLIK